MKIKKRKFYTFKDLRTGCPCITVCLLIDDKKRIARGISICSVLDDFDEKEGKQISERRALRSLKGRQSDRIKSKDAWNVLKFTDCHFKEKGYLLSIFGDGLTYREKYLLFGNP